jgi:nucleoside-diphosphate-sugar epimerase
MKVRVTGAAGFIGMHVCERKPQGVINLPAQAGVRHSPKNPQAYADPSYRLCKRAGGLSPPGCRAPGVRLQFYGGNTKMPFSEHDNVDHPVRLYAAAKKANELMAHSYSHLSCDQLRRRHAGPASGYRTVVRDNGRTADRLVRRLAPRQYISKGLLPALAPI